MRLPPARPLCRESERSLVRRRVLHAARRRNSSVFQGLGLAKAGGSTNLLPLPTPALTNFVRSDIYEPVADSARAAWDHLRALACHDGTSDAVFLRILEAPPGFEPGMEVLQIRRGSVSCWLASSSGSGC
jgi:hypothetical protein